MSSSRPAGIAAIVFGLLAVAAIPVAVAAAVFLPSVDVLPALEIAVPTALVLGLDRALGLAAGALQARPQRLPDRRTDRPLRTLPRLGGDLLRARRRPRARLLRAAPRQVVVARVTEPARARVRSLRACSRSGTACVRRVLVARSSYRRPSWRRRSASSTCGHSRRSGSRRSRLRPTSRAFSGRTPIISASTASSTSTSSTLATSAAMTGIPGRAARRCARNGAPAGSRRASSSSPSRSSGSSRSSSSGPGRRPARAARRRRRRRRRRCTRSTSVSRPSAFLQIEAVNGSSYVSVHRTGPTGRPLFQGTIEKGGIEPFKGKYFWLDISQPENLVIVVGGKQFPISGSKPVVLTVTPSGAHVG